MEAQTLSYESYEGAIETATVPKGAQIVGMSADGKHCLGWLDDRFLVLPNGRAYGSKIRDVQWLFQLYLAAAKRWEIDTADNAVGSTFYRADTREWTTDWATGTIIIDKPRVLGSSGVPSDEFGLEFQVGLEVKTREEGFKWFTALAPMKPG